MEMKVIAKHVVKPSSPTPDTFKNHKLSSLDQIAPPTYIPLIFFYENDESKHKHEEISRRLKQSLSEILTVFYPLAGTIKQNSSVDCDDTGAEFVEARVHTRLAQLIQDPKMEELKQLVPVDNLSHNKAILSVKTSYFDCGGIAVSVCLSHKIGDAASFTMFMNAWAATCRGESSRIIHPSFDMALHFPPTPRDLSWATETHDEWITKEKMVTKRLVFESKKIEKLRAEGAAISSPTRAEAVSAFIWRNFIEAAKGKAKSSSSSSFAAAHIVNLRPRAVPPLPDQTFGNCITAAVAAMPSEEDDGESGVLVSKLRAAIRAVDDDYINNFVKDGNYITAQLESARDFLKPGNCSFTSWWRFPVYGVDFGWGKPVWVCTTTLPWSNLVIFMGTPSGDGIEAWINIPDDHFFQMLQASFNTLHTNQ